MASRMARPDGAVAELGELAGEPLTGGPAAEVTEEVDSDAVFTTLVRAGWLWVQSRSPAEDSWQIGPCWNSDTTAEATDAATTDTEGAAETEAVETEAPDTEATDPVGAASSWWWPTGHAAGWATSTTSSRSAGAHQRNAHLGTTACMLRPFTTIPR